MSAVKVVFLVWFASVFVLGVSAAVVLPRVKRGRRLLAVSGDVRAVLDEGIERFGRIVTAAVIWLAGAALTVVLCWWAGKLAHSLQDSVDWPVFRWWQARRDAGWSDIWLKLTNIGMPRLTQAFAFGAAVVFALVWLIRGRRWWAPLLMCVFGYGFEKFGQIIIQDVVDRGHPPTTLGTFPSGGCARVLIVYGTIIFLTVRWWAPTNRRAWAAGGTLLALLLSIQAYARIYNLEHWITDVFGGVIFGILGLTVMVSVFSILDRDAAKPGHGQHVNRHTPAAEDEARLASHQPA